MVHTGTQLVATPFSAALQRVLMCSRQQAEALERAADSVGAYWSVETLGPHQELRLDRNGLMIARVRFAPPEGIVDFYGSERVARRFDTPLEAAQWVITYIVVSD